MAWNSSGYESVESLRRLEGLVQIYMKDTRKGLLDISKAGELGIPDAYAVLRLYGDSAGRTENTDTASSTNN